MFQWSCIRVGSNTRRVSEVRIDWSYFLRVFTSSELLLQTTNRDSEHSLPPRSKLFSDRMRLLRDNSRVNQ